MTSTDLVVQSSAYSRANLTERQQYVGMLVRAGDLLPEKLRGQGMVQDPATGRMVPAPANPGKTFLLCETGDMLGIHPIAAMTGVHIIEGKPSISANLMTGLVRKAGHKLRVKVEGALEDKSLRATAQLIREDDPDFTFEVVWTIAKAERAGLFPGKPASNWAKYPEAMLKARATSEIVREGASDVLMGGNVYTPEELGATVDEQGEPVELVQTDASPVSHGGTEQGDVPRETPMATPRPETPIPAEEPKAAAAGDMDWGKAIRGIGSSADARALYQQAKAEGSLDSPVKVGRKAPKPLGEILTEIGKSMVEAEKAAEEQPVEATVETADGETVPAERATEDPNVVDADVVDEPTSGVAFRDSDEPQYG